MKRIKVGANNKITLLRHGDRDRMIKYAYLNEIGSDEAMERVHIIDHEIDCLTETINIYVANHLPSGIYYLTLIDGKGRKSIYTADVQGITGSQNEFVYGV